MQAIEMTRFLVSEDVNEKYILNKIWITKISFKKKVTKIYMRTVAFNLNCNFDHIGNYNLTYAH